MTAIRLLLSMLLSAGLWTVTFTTAAPHVADHRPAPATRPATRPTARHVPSRSDLDSRADALRARYGPRGFCVIVEPPFVVLGDESPEQVRSHAVYTVRWAVDHVKKEFCDKDPGDVLEIWLFKDQESYRKHTKEIFDDDPDTPFGYYSPKHRALIMDISTGGGTLVHEIVHPFVRATYPLCPAWLNEGLASLFEQAAEKDGKMVGQLNWRLAGLKRTIRRGELPTFEKLMALANDAFYAAARGDNYAQSRYLLFYLQEKGLLHRYWKACLDDRQTDPTGCAALKKVLGREDLAAFQREWEKYVLGLKLGS